VDVTRQQRMLTPPRHLILLSLLSRVRVVLHYTLCFAFWIMVKYNTLLTSLFDILDRGRNLSVLSVIKVTHLFHLSIDAGRQNPFALFDRYLSKCSSGAYNLVLYKFNI
jgi:hypothetical protein